MALLFAVAASVLLALPGAAAAEPGCGQSLGLRADSPVGSATVSAASPSACWELVDGAADDMLILLGDPGEVPGRSVELTVLDGDGRDICGYMVDRGSCWLSGTPGWRLRATATGDESGSIGVSATRVSRFEGCEQYSLADHLAFDDPPTQIDLAGSADRRCFTLTDVGAADKRLMIDSVVSSEHATQSELSVFGDNGGEVCGSLLCAVDTPSWFDDGPPVLMVTHRGRGAARIALRTPRANAPVGCGQIDTAFGTAPSSGVLAAHGGAACWQPSDHVAGDAYTWGATAESWLVPESAAAICRGSTGPGVRSNTAVRCSDEDGRPTFVVMNTLGDAPRDYSLEARNVTNPVGCDAATFASPASRGFRADAVPGTVDGPIGSICFVLDTNDPAPAPYWLRVSGTAAATPWFEVFGPDNGAGCFSPFRCLSPGRHLLVVHPDWGSTPFAVQVMPLAGGEQCDPLAFSVVGQIGAEVPFQHRTDVRCFALDDPGDEWLGLRLHAGAQHLDADLITESTRWECSARNVRPLQDCGLSDADGPRYLLLYESAGSRITPPFTASVAAHRTAGASACAPYPGERLSFSADFTEVPSTPSGHECFRIGDASTQPARYRVFGAGATSLYDSSGQRACTAGLGEPVWCDIGRAGPVMVVAESGGSTAVRGAAPPSGCQEVPSVRTTFTPVASELRRDRDERCFRFKAVADDRVSLRAEGDIGLVVSVIDGEGSLLCAIDVSDCELSGPAPYSAVVSAPWGGHGAFTLTGRCKNAPCGPSDPDVVAASPTIVGAATSVTLTLSGRELDRLESAKLVQGDTELPLQLRAAVSANGRTRVATVATDTAPPGDYELRGQFQGGAVRTVPSAVTVGPTVAPETRVTISGRPVFRGNTLRLTVGVTNLGNVDAIAVPVTISGLPAGSAVSTNAPMAALSGSADAPTMTPTEFGPEAVTDSSDGRVVPIIATRIPAGQSTQVEVLARTDSPPDVARVEARAGACLESPTTGGSGPTSDDVFQAGVTCALTMFGAIGDEMLDVAIGSVPGGACVIGAAHLLAQALDTGRTGEAFISWPNAYGWALDAAGCALSFLPGWSTAAGVLRAISVISTATSIANDCLTYTGTAMAFSRVSSYDPNDIVGPHGTGSQRYLPGDAAGDYRAYFENKSTATAPAQRVRITVALDAAKFDLSTLVLRDVEIGSQRFDFAVPAGAQDETFDLRPKLPMKVNVQASVSDSGVVSWDLQAVDPATGLPPEDPLAGMLPPNITSPEGEGSVGFSVGYQTLPSGAQLAASASIVFDDNPAIDTPTWINTVDHDAPVASLQAQATGPLTAAVTWTGSDVGAGVADYDVRVADAAGSVALLAASGTSGTAEFKAPAPGRYRFAARAVDRAGLSSAWTAPVEVEVFAPAAADPAAPAPANPEPPTTQPAFGPLTTSTALVAAPRLRWSGAKRSRVTFSPTRRGALPVRASCAGPGPDCTVSIVLRRRGARALRTSTVTVRAGKTRRLSVRLSKRQFTQLRRRPGTYRLSLAAARGGLRTELTRSVRVSVRR